MVAVAVEVAGVVMPCLHKSQKRILYVPYYIFHTAWAVQAGCFDWKQSLSHTAQTCVQITINRGIEVSRQNYAWKFKLHSNQQSELFSRSNAYAIYLWRALRQHLWMFENTSFTKVFLQAHSTLSSCNLVDIKTLRRDRLYPPSSLEVVWSQMSEPQKVKTQQNVVAWYVVIWMTHLVYFCKHNSMFFPIQQAIVIADWLLLRYAWILPRLQDVG